MAKEEKEAVVKTKKNKEGRKVWLCEATVNVGPAVLWAALADTDNLTSWNSTLTTSRVVRTLAEDVKVTYQVTSEGGGGLGLAAEEGGEEGEAGQREPGEGGGVVRGGRGGQQRQQLVLR